MGLPYQAFCELGPGRSLFSMQPIYGRNHRRAKPIWFGGGARVAEASGHALVQGGLRAWETRAGGSGGVG